MQQDPSEGSVDFAELSKRVFELSTGGILYIGGNKPTDQQRALLKDQATNFLTTQLWEVISATLRNEAATLALKKSTTWDHVTFAKALDYVESAVEKMLITLAK